MSNDFLREVRSGLPEGIASPNTDRVMRAAARIIQDRWQSAADAHVRSGAYLAAIRRGSSIHWLDDDTIQVLNTAPHAQWLEYGHAAFSLADKWTKWKVGKSGKRYAIVPFGHSAPTGPGATNFAQKTAMPGDIYKLARTLPSGGHLSGMGTRGIPAGRLWKSSPYEGLYRYDAGGTPRGGSQTRYQSYRTITPDSEGWLIPAAPAYHFAERALEEAVPIIDRMLRDAAVQDMQAALGAALSWMKF